MLKFPLQLGESNGESKRRTTVITVINIYHHVKVSQTPAETKRLIKEGFGESHKATLCSHKKHHQDLTRSVMCDIKFKQNSKKRCSMGTGQNKACDFTFLGYMHGQVM